MAECKLCAEMRLQAGRKPWNEPLIETKNFALVPSLGALVEGWVLLIPKAHHISMGALPLTLRHEAETLEHRARAALKARYQKPIIAFEHGPSAEEHGTGCGVDHAHLHLLPLECDLLMFADPFLPTSIEWKTCNWEDLAKAHADGLDYLYIHQEGKPPHMAVCSDFGSQVFRKAVASFLAMEDQFSWREYPQIETVARTIGTLTNAFDNEIGMESEHAT